MELRTIIVEDEQRSREILKNFLEEFCSGIKIVGTASNVEEAVLEIKSNNPDVVFLDIELQGGTGFEVLSQVSNLDFEVIFTTAFDQYAVKAVKYSSLDYLMKPIKKDELKQAIEKYRSIYSRSINFEPEKVRKLIQQIGWEQPKKYKKSFLVYVKDKIIPIEVEKIAYFSLEHEIVYCYTHSQERYRIEQSLDSIQSDINPEDFFRANRQFICSRKSIHSASVYFQRKLKLEVRPSFPEEISISKLKITAFKKWLSGI